MTLHFLNDVAYDAESTQNSKIGETGANGTRGKMKQRDFSNDDAIYDLFYSN